MKVLIACEFSGVVREAFRKRGHEAWSCDLLPSLDNSPFHVQRDVLELIHSRGIGIIDLLIAHPPCTYLCSSGLHWNKKDPTRALLTTSAIEFVLALANASVEKIAIENPIGCLSSSWRKPDQIIQPYQFGHDASKSTCLWLKGLPLLKPTRYVEPRLIDGKKRWANQTDSGQNKLGPSKDRWALRSITYQGIADAMAEQWGARGL